MEDQDKKELITQTAGIKHKNQLFSTVALSPEWLSSTLCSLFPAISLSRKLVSFFPTSHQHHPNFVLFKISFLQQTHSVILPARPTKDYFQPNIIEVSKILISQGFWGWGGTIHSHKEERNTEVSQEHSKAPMTSGATVDMGGLVLYFHYSTLIHFGRILHQNQNTSFSQIFSSVRH